MHAWRWLMVYGARSSRGAQSEIDNFFDDISYSKVKRTLVFLPHCQSASPASLARMLAPLRALCLQLCSSPSCFLTLTNAWDSMTTPSDLKGLGKEAKPVGPLAPSSLDSGTLELPPWGAPDYQLSLGLNAD
jgi:hypothetical protein